VIRLLRAGPVFALTLCLCNAELPPRGPERTCAKACTERARQCSDSACARGCNLVLDRLVENEGGRVVSCVARGAPRCDDHAWAACAARVGPHADGGPPAPPVHTNEEGDVGE
jgi:hypothetical protein